MNAGIIFKQLWRGRQPGQVDVALDHGVMVELVRRGIAEYVRADDEDAAKTPAAKAAATSGTKHKWRR